MNKFTVIIIAIFVAMATLLIINSAHSEVITEADLDGYIDEYMLFYESNKIEFKGHIWWPVVLEHHPECPCGGDL